MADSFTPFCNLTNPEVGASSDTWGGKENADRTAVDAMLADAISGLTLSTAGSSGTFGIAPGGAAGMVLSSAYTKTTSSWALGTAAGGLDTGAIANTTWYHVWLIQRSDTGVVDVLVSLSATAPTMPTNYDRKRWIGAMKTDSSAHWVAFFQKGRHFIWARAPATDVNTNPTMTQTAVAVDVPTGVNVIARLRGWFQIGDSSEISFLVSSPLETGTTSVGSSFPNTAHVRSGVGIALDQSFTVDVFTNTSAQVNIVAETNDVSNLVRMSAYGWIDPRGQW